MRNCSTLVLFCFFVDVVCFVSCSSCDKKGRSIDAVATDGFLAPERPDARKTKVRWRSSDGILLPSSQLPFGTPVPVRMKKIVSGIGWCRYEGRWKFDDVVRFYRRYLKMGEGRGVLQKGRAYIFQDARPLHPGNPGRKVEVRVVDERDRGKTAVVIFDNSGNKTPQQLEKEHLMHPRQWKPSRPGEFPPDELL